MIFEIGIVALFFAFKHWQKEDAKKQPEKTKYLNFKETCVWAFAMAVLLLIAWLI